MYLETCVDFTVSILLIHLSYSKIWILVCLIITVLSASYRSCINILEVQPMITAVWLAGWEKGVFRGLAESDFSAQPANTSEYWDLFERTRVRHCVIPSFSVSEINCDHCRHCFSQMGGYIKNISPGRAGFYQPGSNRLGNYVIISLKS